MTRYVTMSHALWMPMKINSVMPAATANSASTGMGKSMIAPANKAELVVRAHSIRSGCEVVSKHAKREYRLSVACCDQPSP